MNDICEIHRVQRLQTIIATTDAMHILKALPRDLHPYIYKFITDEVKVHYWMDKYDWNDTLHYLGDYYDGLHLVFSYFHYIKDNVLNSPQHEHDDVAEFKFLHDINAYREKDKWRDADGRVTHTHWSWNDDQCDYPAVYDRLGGMIYKLWDERRDMNGLYKLLSHLISLYDDIDTYDDDEDE